MLDCTTLHHSYSPNPYVELAYVEEGGEDVLCDKWSSSSISIQKGNSKSSNGNRSSIGNIGTGTGSNAMPCPSYTTTHPTTVPVAGDGYDSAVLVP